MKNIALQNIPLIDKKILDDYWKFFTTEEGADMLPYVYMESSHLYDELVKNTPEYYLFNDEVDLIKNNKEQIGRHLESVTDLIEVGPGSCHTIEHKTLPILSYAPNLTTYHALDCSENYLVDAINFIKRNTKSIEIKAIEADLLQLKDIQLSKKTDSKKAVMMLGTTFANFSNQEQCDILVNLHRTLCKNDILIITIDTNRDEKLLIPAYNNHNIINFFTACLNFFIRIYPFFINHLNSFKPVSAWNNEINSIDFYLVAKTDLSFQFFDYGLIEIKKGQKLRGIKSRKPKKEDVLLLLKNNKFITKDILNNSEKMQMFICTRE